MTSSTVRSRPNGRTGNGRPTSPCPDRGRQAVCRGRPRPFLRAVGWAMMADRDSELAMDARRMAVWRCGKADPRHHPPDQGTKCTSKRFQRPAGRQWDHLLEEPGRQCLGQFRDGSFFSSRKTERTARNVHRSPCRNLRPHRDLLQPVQAAMKTGLSQPDGISGPRRARLACCPRSRRQSTGLSLRNRSGQSARSCWAGHDHGWAQMPKRAR